MIAQGAVTGFRNGSISRTGTTKSFRYMRRQPTIVQVP